VTSFHEAAARQRSVVLGLLERCRRRIDVVDQLSVTLAGCERLVDATVQAIHDTATAFVQVPRPSVSFGAAFRAVKVGFKKPGPNSQPVLGYVRREHL